MLQLLRTSQVLLLLILCFQQAGFSQNQVSVYNGVLGIPSKLLEKISVNTDQINNRITRQTEKYLHRISREEKKLKNKLAKKDSIAAKQIFGDAETQYSQWQERIKNVSSKTAGVAHKYIPRFDTLQTALKFLGNKNALLEESPGIDGKFKEAISKMDVLQSKFNQAEDIKNYLKYRRQFLQERLAKYGMTRELQQFKKQVYYYHSQVEEYKRMIDDPSLLESKALEVLKQTPMFKNFFNKHSQLAAMFNLPGNSTASMDVNFSSLQTRAAVQQVLTQRFGSGINVQQMIQQQVQGGQSQLAQLKDKINQLGGGGSDREMPNFKPNNQKVKRLKNRLEFGTNLQTVKSNRFFPSTSDIGLSLGYRLNDKSTIGLGSSYKIGWGKDIRHINVSHQGVGMRSFIDYKIKGNFWLAGGGELNYRSQFRSFEILDDYSAWQKSALLGVSKKYKVSNKIKGNAQLIYDFLWKGQVPRTQPVIFRVGYYFK